MNDFDVIKGPEFDIQISRRMGYDVRMVGAEFALFNPIGVQVHKDLSDADMLKDSYEREWSKVPHWSRELYQAFQLPRAGAQLNVQERKSGLYMACYHDPSRGTHTEQFTTVEAKLPDLAFAIAQAWWLWRNIREKEIN